MKVALIGGHMAPAIGLINSFQKSTEIIYIGRKQVFEGDSGISLEEKTVHELGILFIPFQTGRLQRVFTKQTLPSLLKVPKGFLQAITLLKNEKPDIVVGFGGYLSVPIGFAAKILGIPLLIHESTMAIGLANKILAPFADRICISWETSRPYFPKGKTVLTGDPLLPFSSSIGSTPLPKSQESLPLIFITGGSGGSHVINMTIMQILPELLEISKILHQTGDAREFRDYDKLIKKKKTLPQSMQQRYSVVKFIRPENIHGIFSRADLVVGRSGVNTIATLLVLGKKAVLIPLLAGQKNEQLKNARFMENEGLATILNQNTLSGKLLFQSIISMLHATKKPEIKWQIPVIKNGAENLMKEVIQCAKLSRNG